MTADDRAQRLVQWIHDLSGGAPAAQGGGFSAVLEGIATDRSPLPGLTEDEARKVREALGKAMSGAPFAPLPRRLTSALEAIVLREGRPVSAVREKSFDDSVEPYRGLNKEVRARIALGRALPGIGRVEIDGYAGPQQLGTGFVVGPGLVLTNRHVARLFTDFVGFASGLAPLRRDLNPRFDTSVELSEDEEVIRRGAPLPIVGVRFVHPVLDAALLVVDGAHASDLALPLARSRPTLEAGGRIATVGYPALDLRQPLDVQTDIYGQVLGVKRLAVGQLIGDGLVEVVTDFGTRVDALRHDATTLGGCSGSAVIYLPRLKDDVQAEIPRVYGQVIGLHFAGRYLTANYAIPLWSLFEDTRARSMLEGKAPNAVAPPVPASPPGPAEAAPGGDAVVCDERVAAQEADGVDLTPPSADPAPSGATWIGRYPCSALLQDLSEPFGTGARGFIDALRAAGAEVRVLGTWRPPERAWLAHWSGKVASRLVGPGAVPTHPRLPIAWDHGNLDASISAAADLQRGLGLSGSPPLRSRHTEGRAVDLDVRWPGTLSAIAADGIVHEIPAGDQASSEPLRAFAATFGLYQSVSNSLHWSDDGS